MTTYRVPGSSLAFRSAGRLTRAEFGEATFENWESEFPQMGVYAFASTTFAAGGTG